MTISLRDYFAAKAMQALIQAKATLPSENEESFAWASACGVGGELSSYRIQANGEKIDWTWDGMLAWEAYGIADAMLNEKDK